QPRDALEFLQLALLRRLQLLLELLGVRLAVGDALLAPVELDEPPLRLLLASAQPLLELDRLRPPGVQIVLDLSPELDRLLLRLELRLAPEGLGLAPRLRAQELPRAPGRGAAGAGD